MAHKKQRLDQYLAEAKLVASRSQAESYIRLGRVTVNKKVVTKAGALVSVEDAVDLKIDQQYVSRAGLKLASVAELFKVDFRGKTVLDVGSSTGGFTDYALRHGATKVLAVDVGSDQLHPSLRGNEQVELHEKTDIRDFKTDVVIDIVLADVSFISLREILPSVSKLCAPKTQLIIMVKPQFEAGQSNQKHKGVIKNDKMRRDILNDFEDWARHHFVVLDKADSDVAGSKGNLERFYLLQIQQ
jgi:23S rRNA (cytidine1920-2'-O)/16S rRNA (cytidine1409-2'-O)-methyltransferase